MLSLKISLQHSGGQCRPFHLPEKQLMNFIPTFFSPVLISVSVTSRTFLLTLSIYSPPRWVFALD